MFTAFFTLVPTYSTVEKSVPSLAQAQSQRFTELAVVPWLVSGSLEFLFVENMALKCAAS